MPIIAPIRHKKVEVLEKEALKTKYSNEFLKGLMGNPDLIRNVAVVGHLHHGKTLVRKALTVHHVMGWIPHRAQRRDPGEQSPACASRDGMGTPPRATARPWRAKPRSWWGWGRRSRIERMPAIRLSGVCGQWWSTAAASSPAAV